VSAGTGRVSVGTDHDTSAFAVATLRTWWDTVGRARYPNAQRLLICADSGGANGSRVRAWKIELAAFAPDTALQVTVAHLPPEPASRTRSSTDCSPRSPSTGDGDR
jgi:hypothetical protein